MPILEEPEQEVSEPAHSEDSSLVAAVPALKRVKTWFLGKWRTWQSL